MLRATSTVSFVFFLFSTSALRPTLAQTATEWDVTLARGETREIDFTTEEGTWMSVDISPNGEWIVFDLLAHVYRIPVAGGNAQSLTQESGVAVNYHPQYSPDGQHIAFISDRGGQNNLWVMNADGSNPRAVFQDLDLRATHPVWMPDGNYIIVRRQSVRPGGGGGGGGNGLYMYHINGGEGIRLGEDELDGARWPSVSADGAFIYYHEATPGQTVSWTVRDVLQGSYNISRFEVETGRVTSVTSGVPSRQYRLSSGGAYAGEVSPDGRWLAFARRIPDGTIEWKGHQFGPRSALWLRNLETGVERVVMDPIEQDMAEGMKTLQVLPSYSWDADGQSVVLSQGGKIRRLWVETGRVETIPMTVRVRRTISEQAYSAFDISDESFRVQFTRYHVGSPSGDRVAFQGAGKIYVMDLPQGAPRRMTGDGFDDLEYTPAWSPDGQWVVFASVDDVGAGHLWKVRASGGTPERLTANYGEYMHPVWSPDGSVILAVRGSGATARTRTMAHNPYFDIVLVPASGGDVQPVIRVPGPTLATRSQFVRPTFGPNDRIYYPVMGTGRDSTRLMSVRMDGRDVREHLVIPYADEVVVSPTAEWVAFNEGDNVYTVPLPLRGRGVDPIVIDKRDGRGSIPVAKLSREGGIHPSWRDQHTVQFGSGVSYYTHNLASNTADTAEIVLRIERDLPAGSIAITGARVITMDDRQVLDNATIVARAGRITCVGQCDATGVDRTVNGTGKTIIPGFIDMHSHFFREHRGVIPKKAFETAVPLAYGVTTNLDNSMWSQDVFPAAEMIEAGLMIGPRTYSTGDPLYSGDRGRQNELTSYEIAEENVDRLQSWGAVSLKQYMQPRRAQRQWVSEAARRKGLMVTAEGSDLAYNLSMIMDGQTAFEHPMSYMPMYSDAARFFGQARAVYSPTFVVGGPSAWNDEYFLAESEIWKDEKLRLWMPWQQLVPHSRRRMMRPVTDYSYPILAQVLADIIAEGGHGAIGAHGQQHGLASHWEVWMAASAMGEMGALELATTEGAYFLGASDDVGSLSVGKLADLVVLNSNPLDDIRNTTDIQFVMKGGVLYDGMTLDELWPRQRPYGARPWINSDVWRSGPIGVDHWDRVTTPTGSGRVERENPT